MPGVITPQRSPGLLNGTLSGIQTALSLKQGLSNGSGQQPQDPGTAPQAGVTGDPDQAARGAAIQRRIQTGQGGGY